MPPVCRKKAHLFSCFEGKESFQLHHLAEELRIQDCLLDAFFIFADLIRRRGELTHSVSIRKFACGRVNVVDLVSDSVVERLFYLILIAGMSF